MTLANCAYFISTVKLGKGKLVFRRLVFTLILASCLCRPLAGLAEETNTELQGLVEERDYLARMSKFFKPEFWISYNGTLFFFPKGDKQSQWLKTGVAAKSRYSVLTNKDERYDLATKYVAESGVAERWQKMVLVPRSGPGRESGIFPKLGKPLTTIREFKLLQSFENGDALIQDSESTFYVLGLGRAVDDKVYLNAELIKEGLKTYTTVLGGTKTVESYTSVSLNDEEEKVLSRISASFSKRVMVLTEKIRSLVDRQKKQQPRK